MFIPLAPVDGDTEKAKLLKYMREQHVRTWAWLENVADGNLLDPNKLES